MSNVGSLIASLVDQVETVNEKTRPNLRRGIYRALERLDSWKAPFNQATHHFSTTDGYGEYSSTAVTTSGAELSPDFPIAIREVIAVHDHTDDNASAGIPLERAQVEHIRRMSGARATSSVTATGDGSRPCAFAWWANQLHLGPTPGDEYDLVMDYVVSSIYTTAGVKFSTIDPNSDANDGWTNAWFTDGRAALEAAVLLDYYRRFTKDYEASLHVKAELDDIQRDLAELWVMTDPFARAEPNWGD